MEEPAGDAALEDAPQVLTTPFERGLAGVAGSLLAHAAVLALAFTSRAHAAEAELTPSPRPAVQLDVRLALPVAQPDGAFTEREMATQDAPEQPVAVPPAGATQGGSGTLESMRAATRPRGEMAREAAFFGLAGWLGTDDVDVRTPWTTTQIASSEEGGSRATTTDLGIDAPIGEAPARAPDGIALRGAAGSALLGTCAHACRESEGRAAAREIAALSSFPARAWARGRGGSPRVRLDLGSRVSGPLPPQVIRRIVRQSFGRLRLCYEQALSHRPDLEAHVTAMFVIGRDGEISSVSGASRDAPSALVACVKRAFHGISFPEPDGGTVTVTYPIVFSTRG